MLALFVNVFIRHNQKNLLFDSSKAEFAFYLRNGFVSSFAKTGEGTFGMAVGASSKMSLMRK